MNYDSNLPMGASCDPRAPWNEVEPDARNFDVEFMCLMRKKCEVSTSDYTMTWEGEPDTSDTDWKGAYESDHYTPLELIGEFKKLIDKVYDALPIKERRKYNILREECDGWDDDDIIVE